MKGRFWDAFDYILFICVIILVATGIAFIYSSGIDADGILRTNEYIKQIIWTVIGLAFMIFFALYDYRKLERPAQWIYAASIILLVITFLFGKKVNGARSWLGIGDFGIQPSEFTKIVFILALAKYLDIYNRISNFYYSLRTNFNSTRHGFCLRVHTNFSCYVFCIRNSNKIFAFYYRCRICNNLLHNFTSLESIYSKKFF